MIIEYPSRKARCKDCIYCGYYYPIKKNGEESNMRRHRCKRTGRDILLSDYVCNDWRMGCGIPSNYNHIKIEGKQALIDLMRGDEEIGLYDDNPKNHGYER